MKKIFMLAIVLTVIAGSAFSNPTDAINQKALSAFAEKFTNAELVRWEVKNNLYKVTFKAYGQTLFAYYNAEGEQVALTRNLQVSQLPLNLAGELQKNFSESWLTELFEVVADGETVYYATIETSTHTTILRADISGWTVFKKEKKN